MLKTGYIKFAKGEELHGAGQEGTIIVRSWSLNWGLNLCLDSLVRTEIGGKKK